VDKLAVINASPLIFLSRGNYIELLHSFADRILVPEPVASEIQAKGPQNQTAQVIDSIPWFETVPVSCVPDVILEWGLGIGESSVIAYAYQHPGIDVIIDDLAGRKCATCFGIPVRGTLGIVLVAKKRGLIPKARPILEHLIQNGLYLSKQILDEALQRVGE
jgi:predicted nucleic acid-binding protein